MSSSSPSLRRRAWFLLNRPGVEGALLGLILVNAAAVVAETFAEVRAAWGPGLDAFEAASVAVFTLEYLVRLWTAPEAYPDHPRPRRHLARSFLAMVDLVSIVPFYLPWLVPLDLRTLRLLRVLRLVRLLKLGRFLASLETVRRVLNREKPALVASFSLLGLLLLLASCLMWAAEHEAQPGAFPHVGAALWWAVVTLTTVGYGDIYPVTVLGKVLSGTISLVGIGIVALPTAILSTGFLAEYQLNRPAPGAEVFRNKKKGTLYEVVHRAKDCTNARDGNPVVVYRSVDDPSLVFVRDEAEFHEKFEAMQPGPRN